MNPCYSPYTIEDSQSPQIKVETLALTNTGDFYGLIDDRTTQLPYTTAHHDIVQAPIPIKPFHVASNLEQRAVKRKRSSSQELYTDEDNKAKSIRLE
ncbi:MAG: hypothetical protein Q9220_001830 [cf. Caloplaca sp. 1 TL-2023]